MSAKKKQFLILLSIVSFFIALFVACHFGLSLTKASSTPHQIDVPSALLDNKIDFLYYKGIRLSYDSSLSIEKDSRSSDDIYLMSDDSSYILIGSSEFNDEIDQDIFQKVFDMLKKEDNLVLMDRIYEFSISGQSARRAFFKVKQQAEEKQSKSHDAVVFNDGEHIYLVMYSAPETVYSNHLREFESTLFSIEILSQSGLDNAGKQTKVPEGDAENPIINYDPTLFVFHDIQLNMLGDSVGERTQEGVKITFDGGIMELMILNPIDFKNEFDEESSGIVFDLFQGTFLNSFHSSSLDSKRDFIANKLLFFNRRHSLQSDIESEGPDYVLDLYLLVVDDRIYAPAFFVPKIVYEQYKDLILETIFSIRIFE